MEEEAIYGSSNFAYAAEYVLAPIAAFPLESPYKELVSKAASSNNFLQVYANLTRNLGKTPGQHLEELSILI